MIDQHHLATVPAEVDVPQPPPDTVPPTPHPRPPGGPDELPAGQPPEIIEPHQPGEQAPIGDPVGHHSTLFNNALAR